MNKPKHKNGGTIMSNSERDLALAKALLDRGEMDAAEELLDKVERKMSAQAAADDADDDQDEDTLDQEDDGTDDEEDDGEGDDEPVAKAFREDGITYPHSDDAFLATGHTNMGPVSADRLSPYTHATGVTPLVQVPSRHPFDDVVDKVMQRDGVSRMAALTTARLEQPALYTQYQQFHAGSTTQQQAMSRNWSTHPVNKLGLPKTPPIYPDSEDTDLQDSGRKKAKTHRRRHRLHDQQVKKMMTYESAVAGEMARGCNRVVAEQRVQHSFGNLLPRSDVAKGAGDTSIVKFMAKVDAVMVNEECDRTEAMRRVRKRNEGLFDAFQIV
jgi:hypothetical protein